MITDALEEALAHRSQVHLCAAQFPKSHRRDPTLERRLQLVELADRYGVPIIEDDPYGQLRYEGEHLPSVVVLDGQFRGTATTATVAM